MSIYFIYLILLIAGLGVGYFVRNSLTKGKISSAEKEAEKIINQAKAKLEDSKHKEQEVLLKAKEAAAIIRDKATADADKRRQELSDMETRLMKKDELLDKRHEELDKRKELLEAQDKELQSVKQEILDIKAKQEEKLEAIAKLSKDEAKEQLFKRIEKEYRDEALKIIHQVEAETKEEAEEKAREILSTAIQRYASETVAETTTAAITIPSDDMKGRIIGKEGRNIQAFERACGVDVIVDDTPGIVTISTFDPVRRAIAKKTLERLIADGRIQPARIEELFDKMTKEVNQEMKKAGEEAVLELGLTGLHPDLIKLIGRLKFRTSYGQNMLNHSVEVAHLAALLASQIGADVRISKLAALLHDIGKALDHEFEGTHVDLSLDIAKKFGLGERVEQAIASHHEGFGGPKAAEDFVVMAADAISSARPGARRESMEQFIKRLEDLEDIATSYPGVEKAFAIQAGREVRVMVEPKEVDDLGAHKMAKEIAAEIEKRLTYPGVIKVNVIREVRAEGTAK
jgi:ribonuclease Y